jgi:hypothetical protein
MPQVGFESTAPVFERAKTFNAPERAATASGSVLVLARLKFQVIMQ